MRGPWVPLLQKCLDICAHRLVWWDQTGTVITFGGGSLPGSTAVGAVYGNPHPRLRTTRLSFAVGCRDQVEVV